MTWFTDLTAQLDPYTDAPDLVKERAMREAARALCTDTAIWRELVTVTLTEGQATVTVPVPSDATALNILAVNGLPRGEGWRAYRPGKFTLIAPVTKDTTLTVEVQCAPEINALELPDHIQTLSGESLRDRALYYLFQLPDFENPQKAESHYIKYLRSLGAVRAAIRSEFSSTESIASSPFPFI